MLEVQSSLKPVKARDNEKGFYSRHSKDNVTYILTLETQGLCC